MRTAICTMRYFLTLYHTMHWQDWETEAASSHARLHNDLHVGQLGMQGTPVTHLTFRPAADGSLHVIASPSAEHPGNTHSVSARPVAPQPIMWVCIHLCSRTLLTVVPSAQVTCVSHSSWLTVTAWPRKLLSLIRREHVLAESATAAQHTVHVH